MYPHVAKFPWLPCLLLKSRLGGDVGTGHDTSVEPADVVDDAVAVAPVPDQTATTGINIWTASHITNN
jgi:hypothetical protein